jgi:hypothetical protein
MKMEKCEGNIEGAPTPSHPHTHTHKNTYTHTHTHTIKEITYFGLMPEFVHLDMNISKGRGKR